MRHQLFGAAIAMAACGAASAGVITIDDFTSGSFGASITSGNVVLQQSGTMLGGQRDIGLEVLSNPFSQFLDAGVGPNGLGLTFSAGIGLEGQLALDYDGSTDVETGNLPFVAGEGLNLDLTGLTSIDFSFLAADLDFEILVVLQTLEGGMVMDTDQVDADVDGGGMGPFTVSVMLSDFAIDLSDVDRIGILFNFEGDDGPTGSLDFILSDITIVPAPGAIALLGLAGLAGTRRRRG